MKLGTATDLGANFDVEIVLIGYSGIEASAIYGT